MTKNCCWYYYYYYYIFIIAIIPLRPFLTSPHFLSLPLHCHLFLSPTGAQILNPICDTAGSGEVRPPNAL